ncbi:rhodanese-like domain-containing protein [Candidatus Nitrosacidococcus sp. I8]|uniref:rhodanese-like domain-containing protein n=1 Tax=Candidatus Nitrosacidococcus sp. I8 TaxID=2942908 RepID=UPI0022269AA1|nr:rhodanese-like domain-containing protein [Candidatus Nitrosacidococcus sp. I8]CAH9014064.1 Thiosulfate sulfurtransferase GlpE [Candidatus Nitrosacidococcus sp. I8]
MNNRLFEFFTNHWMLSVSLVAIIAALAVDPIVRRRRGIRTISVVEITRLINQENAQVVDIREGKDFDKEHILDSMNAPLSTFITGIARLDRFKDRPLILIWGIGQSVLNIAAQLSKRDHKAIYIIEGGIETWRQADMPLFSGRDKDHHHKDKPKDQITLEKSSESQISPESELGNHQPSIIDKSKKKTKKHKNKKVAYE